MTECEHELDFGGISPVCVKCGRVWSPLGDFLFQLTPEQLEKYRRLSKRADAMGEPPEVSE